MTFDVPHLIRCRWVVSAVLVALFVAPGLADEVGPRVVVDGYFHQNTSLKTSGGDPANINNCAGNAIACKFIFGRVPANKQLVVTQVSCWVTVNPDATPRWANLSGFTKDGMGTIPHRDMHLIPVRPYPGLALITAQVLNLFDSGQRPYIDVVFNQATQIGGNCTIAGQIVNAP